MTPPTPQLDRQKEYPYNDGRFASQEVPMNVLVLFGSPRKNGNTIELVKAFAEVLEAKGHQVSQAYLNDMSITPCQGCAACMHEGVCVLDDDMDKLKDEIMKADLLVFATPVYWFTVSAQMKAVMDRSLAFMDENYNSRIKGKKAVTLMTCGSEDHAVCQPALDTFSMTFNLLGLTYAGHVEGLGSSGTGMVKKEYIEQARMLADSLL